MSKDLMRKTNLHELLEMTSATYVCLHRLGHSPIEVLSSQSEKNIDKNYFYANVQKSLHEITISMKPADRLELSHNNSHVYIEHDGDTIRLTLDYEGTEIQTSFSLERPATNSMIKSYSSNEGSSTKSTVQSRHFELNIDNRNKAVPEENQSDFTALSPSFCSSFGLAGPYVAGAMAGGIASVELVTAFSNASLLSFFGAGGLSLKEITIALEKLSTLKGVWGINLLHSPNEPELEEHLVDLFLTYGVKKISASAYMRLSLAVVRYRILGLYKEDGRIKCAHQIFAKVSHPTVAKQFLEPPSNKDIQKLLSTGAISEEQAKWALSIPMCDAITIEGDSGGHTDRRNPFALFPTIADLRNQCLKSYDFHVFLGLAGGIGEPRAFKAALSLGADYVVLGSIHQSTVEAGTSALVKDMLSKTEIDHFSYGFSPDMFEQGALVQVLGKGTMYAQRTQTLRNIYLQNSDLSELSEKDKIRVEKIFGTSIEDVWSETKAYWEKRDPRILSKALKDGKLQMSLVFRWYLGLSSRWARQGEASRKKDFQVWSGPSMGAFNNWVRGTSLEKPENRFAVTIAHTILKQVMNLNDESFS